MNGYRKMMVDQGGNLGWCKPYIGKRVSIALNEGKIVSLMVDGAEIDVTEENVKNAAKIANQFYDDYSGWDDSHIIVDGDTKEATCSQCPWFSVCDAMDNPDDWEDPGYPDD